MPDLNEAIANVAEVAHGAAQEAAEVAIEAAEERAEAAEEARDLMAEAGLRDEISRRVDALRVEHDRCHAEHENRLTGLQTSHDGLQGHLHSLEAELREMAGRLPVVVPLSTSLASQAAPAEAEASGAMGAVVIPAQAEAANAVAPVVPAARKRGKFL